MKKEKHQGTWLLSLQPVKMYWWNWKHLVEFWRKDECGDWRNYETGCCSENPSTCETGSKWEDSGSRSGLNLNLWSSSLDTNWWQQKKECSRLKECHNGIRGPKISWKVREAWLGSPAVLTNQLFADFCSTCFYWVSVAWAPVPNPEVTMSSCCWVNSPSASKWRP